MEGGCIDKYFYIFIIQVNMNIINSAKEIQSSLQNIRRELHQYPEISRNEKRTSEIGRAHV